MNKKSLSALLKVSSFLGACLFGSTSAADTELKVGLPAPDFSLIDQNNQTHRLADYYGKWLVLYFYPKDDTPSCTKEACHFRDDIVAIKQLNANVLGVSVDSKESHKAFSEKYNLQFPLLADIGGEVAQKYNSYFSLLFIKFANRHTFIINPDGKIAKIYWDVDSDIHSKEIIKDLTELTQSYNES